MSKAFCDSKGAEVGKPGTGLLGTGPYVFSSWTQGSEIVLNRNKNYWNASSIAANAADVLDYKIITEGTTLVSAMQSGQVDLTMKGFIPMIDNLNRVLGRAGVYLA